MPELANNIDPVIHGQEIQLAVNHQALFIRQPCPGVVEADFTT